MEILPSARSFEEIQDQVRAYLGHKARIIIETLTPYVDNSAPGFNPEIGTVYLLAIKELGKLYRVQQTTPRTLEDTVPISEVEAMIQARLDYEIAQAVEEALLAAEAERREQQEISLDEARAAVRRQMLALTAKKPR